MKIFIKELETILCGFGVAVLWWIVFSWFEILIRGGDNVFWWNFFVQLSLLT